MSCLPRSDGVSSRLPPPSELPGSEIVFGILSWRFDVRCKRKPLPSLYNMLERTERPCHRPLRCSQRSRDSSRNRWAFYRVRARSRLGPATLGGGRGLISAADNSFLSSRPLNQRVSTNPLPPSLPPPPHRSARHGPVRPAHSPAAWLGLRPRDEGVGAWRGAARGLRHARPRTSLATAAPSHTRGRHRRPRAQTARPAVSLPSVGRGGTSCHSRRVSIKYKENTSA